MPLRTRVESVEETGNETERRWKSKSQREKATEDGGKENWNGKIYSPNQFQTQINYNSFQTCTKMSQNFWNLFVRPNFSMHIHYWCDTCINWTFRCPMWEEKKTIKIRRNIVFHAKMLWPFFFCLIFISFTRTHSPCQPNWKELVGEHHIHGLVRTCIGRTIVQCTLKIIDTPNIH